MVEEIRDIDKGIGTMVMPESKLNRERVEERDMADRFGELEMLVKCKCCVHRGVSW